MEENAKNELLSAINEMAFNYKVRKNDMERGKKFNRLYDFLEQKKDKMPYKEMLKIYYSNMMGIINGSI